MHSRKRLLSAVMTAATTFGLLSSTVTVATQHLKQSDPSTRKSRTGGLPGGDAISPIRQVDFANFAYPSGCSDSGKDPRFPAVITVSKGAWESGNKDDNVSYSVNPPIYGKLIGNGKEQAVIFADCFLGNGDWEEVFVYEMSGKQAAMIQRISYLDCAPDHDFFDLKAVAIRGGRLLASYTAGGNHAQPRWVVTRTFLWNGRKFVPGQADRKPYKP